jgi:hypothetical protein
MINTRMKWAGQVVLRGRGAYRVWWGIPKKRDNLEDNAGDGSAISNRMLTKQVAWEKTGLIWLRMQTSPGFL